MQENYEVQVAEKSSTGSKRVAAAVAAASTFAIVNSAQAAELAVPAMTEIVTMITGMVAVVASVGMAVLSVYATAKVFKWVKTAF